MIEIVGPEADLAELDSVIGIGIGHAAGHRAEPGLADGNHAADERAAGGGLVVGGPNIPRHLLNRLAVPVSGRRVNGVGACPSGDQADVHLRILAVQQFRDLLGRLNQERGVAGFVAVEQAVAEHDDAIPWPANHTGFFGDVVVESLARHGLLADGEVQPSLGRERFEQGGHPAEASAIQIGDRGGSVVT